MDQIYSHCADGIESREKSMKVPEEFKNVQDRNPSHRIGLITMCVSTVAIPTVLPTELQLFNSQSEFKLVVNNSIELLLSSCKADPVLIKMDSNVNQSLFDRIKIEKRKNQLEKLMDSNDIGLYIRVPECPLNSLLHNEIVELLKNSDTFSYWINEYREFREIIFKDITRLNQKENGFSDIFSMLDILANVIEIIGAGGGITLWLYRMILKKRQKKGNPWINYYIKQAEAVFIFYETETKAKIDKISKGTCVSPKYLKFLLKSLGFEKDKKGYWHLPEISDDFTKQIVEKAKTQNNSVADD